MRAARSGSRTILERVRYDGISRCSRAFAHGDAAAIVLSQLGPGVVRGDTVSISAQLGAGAHLIVTSQAATRLLGGASCASARADWTLGERAVLELIGEPIVAAADARYEAMTSVELSGGSQLFMSDVVCAQAGASVRLTTSVQRSGQELYYDAIDAAAGAPQAIGTFAVVGLAQCDITSLLEALDEAGDALTTITIGVGALADGVFARMHNPDVWTVRCALAALRAAAWATLAMHQRAGGLAPAIGSSSADSASRPARRSAST